MKKNNKKKRIYTPRQISEKDFYLKKFKYEVEMDNISNKINLWKELDRNLYAKEQYNKKYKFVPPDTYISKKTNEKISREQLWLEHDKKYPTVANRLKKYTNQYNTIQNKHRELNKKYSEQQGVDTLRFKSPVEELKDIGKTLYYKKLDNELKRQKKTKN